MNRDVEGRVSNRLAQWEKIRPNVKYGPDGEVGRWMKPQAAVARCLDENSHVIQNEANKSWAEQYDRANTLEAELAESRRSQAQAICAAQDWRDMARTLQAELADSKKKLVDEESACLQLLKERDALEEGLDALSAAVGECFGVDLGEWSNSNAPPDVALAVLGGGYVIPDGAPVRRIINPLESPETELDNF